MAVSFVQAACFLNTLTATERHCFLYEDRDWYDSMTAKTLNVCHLGISMFFPTSLCGVLVFRSAPAAPSASVPPPSASAPPRLSLSHNTHHRSSHSPHLTPLITQHTHRPYHTAACFRVAGAVHRDFWLSCGRSSTQSRLVELLGRGWLSCGRRKTQSLEELLRAWAPLGRGWLS